MYKGFRFTDDTIQYDTKSLKPNNGTSLYVHPGLYYQVTCRSCRPRVSGLDCFVSGEYKFLDDAWYCTRCYPQAVDVYLADLRLKGAENETT
jgi:hypothetical protein